MKLGIRTVAMAAVVTLCGALAAQAQAQAQQQDDTSARRFALGLGAGLVDTGATTETYLYGGLRIRFGDQPEHRSGVAGYLEPEVGYWKHSSQFASEEDLMVGVNVGGLVMLRSVAYFMAAGLGVHFLELQRPGLVEDTESLGVNVQFGVDVNVSPSVSLFGVGRIDLVEKLDESTQAKIYLGGRFHF